MNLKTRTTFGAAIGTGFMYKRLGIEARYHFKQDIVGETYTIVGDFSKGMVLLSYKLL